ncbi:hypothetical protein [Neisseria dentiae]|uniref:hypothetical protein n=1 Tax=Neisseria dentiae TaxID=194197 RepID=UPI00211C4735|nr:hypothetical protein [Neisseria dentiae]MCQ9326624.1 hypothetical protein [Neisseria dentiae]
MNQNEYFCCVKKRCGSFWRKTGFSIYPIGKNRPAKAGRILASPAEIQTTGLLQNSCRYLKTLRHLRAWRHINFSDGLNECGKSCGLFQTGTVNPLSAAD